MRVPPIAAPSGSGGGPHPPTLFRHLTISPPRRARLSAAQLAGPRSPQAEHAFPFYMPCPSSSKGVVGWIKTPVSSAIRPRKIHLCTSTLIFFFFLRSNPCLGHASPCHSDKFNLSILSPPPFSAFLSFLVPSDRNNRVGTGPQSAALRNPEEKNPIVPRNQFEVKPHGKPIDRSGDSIAPFEGARAETRLPRPRAEDDAASAAGGFVSPAARRLFPRDRETRAYE